LCVRSWAVAACRAGSLNNLAVRNARSSKSLNKALSTRAAAVSARLGIVASSRAWNGASHRAAVAEAAGGAGQRAGGFTAEVGAVVKVAALRTRDAQSFELRAGREGDGGVQEGACRAAAADAGVDGVDVVVGRPHVQGAIRAEDGG
jgi:hypothetical protein